jgi:heterodisulfide reductase subunit B
LKYGYYPGCSLLGLAKEYNASILAVIEKLELDLPEIDDWSCCGSTAASSSNHVLALALSARNLAVAEKEGRNIVAPCSECLSKMSKTALSLNSDEELRGRINQILSKAGLEYNGRVEVKHVVDYIITEIGLDLIKNHVTKPLTGLKAVPYYGCLITRPREINSFDKVDNPTSMDRIISAIGATCLDWQYKTLCCGASLMMQKEEVALELTSTMLHEAQSIGAHCIIVGCPFCHFNLDIKQSLVKDLPEKGIPILYITQLLGLSFGIDNKKLGLDKNAVSPFKLLESLDLK